MAPDTPPSSPAPLPSNPRRTRRRVLLTSFLGIPLLAGLIAGSLWIRYRFTHALARDAFVDSHLINVSSYVQGNIVEMAVQEQTRVKKGQLLARIDPAIYDREVGVRQGRLTVAESALAKARADLAVLTEEVPRRIAIAERRLDIARQDEEKAVKKLALTTEDVEKGIVAAAAAVTASQAALVLADEDFQRYRDLYRDGSATLRKYQEATKIQQSAQADVAAARARLAQVEATRNQIAIVEHELKAARHAVAEAQAALELARVGHLQIEAARKLVDERVSAVEEAHKALQLAETNLGYTRLVAPHDGIVTKKWRHLGDYVKPGDPLLNLYNPELLYVTVHLEELLLEGVNLGNYATIRVDAFSQPFRGRVVWVGSATDANFSLIPRDVSAGEFTYVVQRVTTRLAFEPDERLDLLKPGLSAHVAIERGPGDPDWARAAWRTMAEQAGIQEPPP